MATLDTDHIKHAAYGTLCFSMCALPPVQHLPLWTSPKSTLTDSQTLTGISDKFQSFSSMALSDFLCSTCFMLQHVESVCEGSVWGLNAPLINLTQNMLTYFIFLCNNKVHAERPAPYHWGSVMSWLSNDVWRPPVNGLMVALKISDQKNIYFHHLGV